VILPGVGAFDDYIARLKDSGIFEVLMNFHSRDIYLLGICIGMHVLADTSDEGSLKGLGLISGNVERLDNLLNLPHMGWNSVASKNSIFDGADLNKGYYFLHNYHFVPSSDKSSIAVTDYGKEINCVVNDKKVYGVQFHPEKSHLNGETLFRNFLELV
jgi:glutamine amidotransferase